MDDCNDTLAASLHSKSLFYTTSYLLVECEKKQHDCPVIFHVSCKNEICSSFNTTHFAVWLRSSYAYFCNFKTSLLDKLILDKFLPRLQLFYHASDNIM